MTINEFQEKYENIDISQSSNNSIRFIGDDFILEIFKDDENKICIEIDKEISLRKEFIDDCFNLYENENNYIKDPIFMPIVQWNALYEIIYNNDDLEIKFYNIHKTNLEIKFLIKDIKDFNLDNHHIYYEINKRISHWDLEKFLRIIRNKNNWKFNKELKNE